MKGLLFHSLRQLAICCLYPPPLQSIGPTTACSSPWPLLPRGSEQHEETFVSCCYETMPVYYDETSCARSRHQIRAQRAVACSGQWQGSTSLQSADI